MENAFLTIHLTVPKCINIFLYTIYVADFPQRNDFTCPQLEL